MQRSTGIVLFLFQGRQFIHYFYLHSPLMERYSTPPHSGDWVATKILELRLPPDLSWNRHIILTSATNLEGYSRNVLQEVLHQLKPGNLTEALICSIHQTPPGVLFARLEPPINLKKLVDELQNVQEFALKMCMKCWDSNYETLLATMQLSTLDERRTKASLCHLFKIINSLSWSSDNAMRVQVSLHHSLISPQQADRYAF